MEFEPKKILAMIFGVRNGKECKYFPDKSKVTVTLPQPGLLFVNSNLAGRRLIIGRVA